MTRSLSPAPDDVAFAVEHRDVEGDVRSLKNPCSRVPSRLGDELANRYPALLGLPQNQQRCIGVAAEFDEIGRGFGFPKQFGKPEMVDAAGLGMKIEQSLPELGHLGKAAGDSD